MTRSYNGWTASPSLKTRVIEPVKGCRLRIRDNDNVDAVFSYLVRNFHKRVDSVLEPHPADDWGFNFRPNRNDPDSLSCHASGTAIDLDATEHPNGVPTTRTFTPRQISEIHEILDELDGVVRWGGDFTRTADAMHFEIIAKPGGLKKIGAKLRKAAAPANRGVKREKRVGFHNLEHSHEPEKHVRLTLARFEKLKLDVLGVSEGRDYLAEFIKQGEALGHQVIHDKSSIKGSDQCYIIVRKGQKVSASWSIEAGSSWFNTKGNKVPPPRPMIAIIDGMTFIAGHAPVAAWRPTKSGRKFIGPYLRRLSYGRFVSRIAKVYKRQKNVVGGFDWNNSPVATGKYSVVWLRNQVGGSFARPGRSTGHGEIDFFLVDKGVTHNKGHWAEGAPSDHDLVWTDVEYWTAA